MCSVVEIKNLEEYCIHYHSLDSMETVDGLLRKGSLRLVGGQEGEDEIHPLFRREEAGGDSYGEEDIDDILHQECGLLFLFKIFYFIIQKISWKRGSNDYYRSDENLF